MEHTPSSAGDAEIQQSEGRMSLTGAEVDLLPDDSIGTTREELQQRLAAGEVDPATLPPGLQELLAPDDGTEVGMGFQSAADSSQVDA